jgi:agmatine deiminase
MSKPMDAAAALPVNEGYAMPAEWGPHRRTWMCWPARLACFGNDERLLRAKQAYARVARAISAFEPVIMAARSEAMAEAKLATSGKVEIAELPTDDGWARDVGPTFLRNPRGRLSGVQWQFNAWGNKYESYANDASFASRVLQMLGVPLYQAPLVCEGGAVHSDGEGTVLTTEQCLLNPNRNPGLTRQDVEQRLHDFLGARKVIWLAGTFADDETDGHIDNIACFAAPGRVLVGVPAARSHPDYEPVREALRQLAGATDAQGRKLEIIEVPQPKKPRLCWRGGPLPASYINFYLPNGGVIMPAFGDSHDEKARTLIAEAFPGRDIMQIDAIDIVEGGGGIHCITQQEPAI